MEKDLEGFGFVVAGLHALQQCVQRRIAGERGHRE